MSDFEPLHERFSGCLLGGAVGDALGYPVEFMQLPEIRRRYGEEGLHDLVRDSLQKVALISDDTQMTLFTADGILVASEAPIAVDSHHYTTCMYHAFQRWLYTQTGVRPHHLPASVLESDILNERRLYASRAPGQTCIQALRRHEGHLYGTMDSPINDSKGCGGVMRVAPVGLFWHHDPELAFRLACVNAAITHGHPCGYLSAGCLAGIVAGLVNGQSPGAALDDTVRILQGYEKHQACQASIDQARDLAAGSLEPLAAIAALGAGWVGEEALAIGLYCALVRPGDCRAALLLAVNHDGDSDSTGSITGNILGAALGLAALPPDWCASVELADFIRQTADRLFLNRPAGGHKINVSLP